MRTIRYLLVTALVALWMPKAKSQCVADYAFTLGGCPMVTFTDLSTTGPGDFIIQWAWDFGDGNTAFTQNPTHTYTANGTYTVCLLIQTAAFCVDTACATVTINCITPPSCNTDFVYTMANCSTAVFADQSTATPGTIAQWTWDFGDGNISAMQNPTHTYTADGSYVVCLTTISTDFCTSVHCDTITVNCGGGGGTCQAFMQYTLGACPNVMFFDGSTSSPGSIISWNWDFGDGNTSTMQNPQNTYAANGTYAVCLDIFTTDSCTSTYCDTLTINCISNPTCTTDFAYTMSSCSTVVFTDLSTSSPGSIMQWTWDFGDGNLATQQNPSHTYSADGTYIVCLTTVSTDLCTSVHCDTITINCGGTPTCMTDFAYTMTSCSTFVFTDMSTASPGSISQWTWDFGDGNSSATQNPSHTYSADGTYIVCLTTVSTDFCTSVHCDTITVNCGGGPGSCQAFYQYTLGNCPTVMFFDGSTATPGTVNSWSWDFGDGNTGTGANPQNTYLANGTYTVCLTIGTTDSCFSTYCDTITISCITGPVCQAAFSYDDTQAPMIAFTDNSATTGNIVSWAWDFGDGNTSSTQNPTHTYGADGSYLVCLTIMTDDSCSSTVCDTVSVITNSIHELPMLPEFGLFPNPAHDILNLTISHLVGDATVSLMDMTGRVVIHEQWPAGRYSNELHVDHIAPGSYMVQIAWGNLAVTKRVIVRR